MTISGSTFMGIGPAGGNEAFPVTQAVNHDSVLVFFHDMIVQLERRAFWIKFAVQRGEDKTADRINALSLQPSFGPDDRGPELVLQPGGIFMDENRRYPDSSWFGSHRSVGHSHGQGRHKASKARR